MLKCTIYRTPVPEGNKCNTKNSIPIFQLIIVYFTNQILRRPEFQEVKKFKLMPFYIPIELEFDAD